MNDPWITAGMIVIVSLSAVGTGVGLGYIGWSIWGWLRERHNGKD